MLLVFPIYIYRDPFIKIAQRTCDLEDYGHNTSFSGNLTYAPWS